MPETSSLQTLFQQCVDQHAESIYRVAFRLTGNRDTAGELVQETYLQAWKGLATLNDPKRMRSWLFGILRNQSTKMNRAVRGERPLLDEPLTQNQSSNRNDQQELVQDAIAQLEPMFQLPLLLVSMEGIPAEEAAEILEIPRGTVLSRLYRGRKKLKKILEPQLNLLQSHDA